ncbi:hypothetical protein GCM10010398_31500 [Streptomyces fimbriatus]
MHGLNARRVLRTGILGGAHGVRGGSGENGAGPVPCHPHTAALSADTRHRTRHIVSIRLIYPDYIPGRGRVPPMMTDPRARYGRGVPARHVPFGALPLGISAQPL